MKHTGLSPLSVRPSDLRRCGLSPRKYLSINKREEKREKKDEKKKTRRRGKCLRAWGKRAVCVSILAATTGREGKRDLHSSASSSSSSSSFLQCCYIDAFCWLCGTVGRRRRIIAHRRKKCLMMSCSLVKKRKTKKSQAVCTRRATWTETRGDREIIRQSAAVTFQNKRIHHTGRHAVVANRCLIWSTADWLNDTSILSI